MIRKNNKFFKIVISTFCLLIGCIKSENDFRLYKHTFPNYIDSIDNDGYRYLNNYNENNILSETLVFLENSFIEYVFYNHITKEPRFIILFDNNIVSKFEGKSTFISSPYFDPLKKSTDSVAFYIYAATPPNFETKIKVLKQNSNSELIEVTNYLVKDDYTLLFIKKMVEKEDLNVTYYVVTKLKSNHYINAEYSDTIKFHVKR